MIVHLIKFLVFPNFFDFEDFQSKLKLYVNSLSANFANVDRYRRIEYHFRYLSMWHKILKADTFREARFTASICVLYLRLEDVHRKAINGECIYVHKKCQSAHEWIYRKMSKLHLH